MSKQFASLSFLIAALLLPCGAQTRGTPSDPDLTRWKVHDRSRPAAADSGRNGALIPTGSGAQFRTKWGAVSTGSGALLGSRS